MNPIEIEPRKPPISFIVETLAYYCVFRPSAERNSNKDRNTTWRANFAQKNAEA